MRILGLMVALALGLFASDRAARADAGAAIEALTRQQIVSLCENRFPYSAHYQEVCIEKQQIGKAGVDKLRAQMWKLHYTGDPSDRRTSDTMRLFDKVCQNKAVRSPESNTDWVEQFYCFKHKLDEAAAAGRALAK